MAKRKDHEVVRARAAGEADALASKAGITGGDTAAGLGFMDGLHAAQAAIAG